MISVIQKSRVGGVYQSESPTRTHLRSGGIWALDLPSLISYYQTPLSSSTNAGCRKIGRVLGRNRYPAPYPFTWCSVNISAGTASENRWKIHHWRPRLARAWHASTECSDWSVYCGDGTRGCQMKCEQYYWVGYVGDVFLYIFEKHLIGLCLNYKSSQYHQA